MAYVTEPFQAFLSKPLDASDVYLPLSSAAYADLLSLLQKKGSYTFLTIRDDTHIETVKAHAEGGYILLERGMAGTQAVKLTYGACVTTVSSTVLAVIQDYANTVLLLNPDAMRTQLGVAICSFPNGSTNTPYEGYIVFSGTIPMQIDIDGLPAWANTQVSENMVTISGTPISHETVNLKFTVTNADSDQALDQNCTFTIS